MRRRSRRISKKKSRKISKRKPRRISKKKSRKISKRKPRKISKRKSRKRSRRKRKQILRSRPSSPAPINLVDLGTDLSDDTDDEPESPITPIDSFGDTETVKLPHRIHRQSSNPEQQAELAGEVGLELLILNHDLKNQNKDLEKKLHNIQSDNTLLQSENKTLNQDTLDMKKDIEKKKEVIKKNEKEISTLRAHKTIFIADVSDKINQEVSALIDKVHVSALESESGTLKPCRDIISNLETYLNSFKQNIERL
jgi:hypothetical protein